MSLDKTISVEYRGRVAVLTISNDKKLGALTQDGYYALAAAMDEIAGHDEVVTTVVTGTGRFFSAGIDVSSPRDPAPDANARRYYLGSFLALQLDTMRAFAHHPKILVAALNGPVVGLSAALVGWADFVYCTPGTFLLTPFASLGLVAEGGSSRALARRLGVARAGEALIMGKRLCAEDLRACGFVNDVFDEVGAEAFLARVLREVDDRLGSHLNGESVLAIKGLLRGPDAHLHEAQSLREAFTGLDRLVRGIPQEEFRKLVRGEKRHKL